MNLRRLEHLVALAEQGSFAGAARKIHLSQPALTRSIQTLEEELGLALFERLPRGAALTAAGRIVFQRAKRVLFESNALSRDVMLFKAHELGEVSFGFGPYPAALLLAEVLSELSGSAPGLAVRAGVGDAAVLLQQLHAETIDFFVAERRAIIPSPEVVMQKLEPYRCGWFARPNHSLFSKGKITVADMRKAEMASVPLAPYGREKLRRALRYGPSESLHFQVECNDFSVLKKLATKSNTIIFAPLAAVSGEVGRGALLDIPVQDSIGFNMEMAVIRLASRTVSPAAARALDAVFVCDTILHHAPALQTG